VQAVLQVALLVSQTKPPGQVEETGAAQAPVPLQWETGVKVEPPQVAVPQETPVPPSWHLPAPSQAPVLPQGGLVAHRPCGSRLLDGTFAQLPGLLLRLQAWQVAQAVALQQTPSTQLLPVRQSLDSAQDCPRPCLVPQRPTFVSQISIVGDWLQSLSAAQAALQAVVPLQT
jgi:hypothetical protein